MSCRYSEDTEKDFLHIFFMVAYFRRLFYLDMGKFRRNNHYKAGFKLEVIVYDDKNENRAAEN